jgi:hypothetical protein
VALLSNDSSRTTNLADLQPGRARPPRIRRGRVALAGVAVTVAATILVTAAVWWARPGPTPSSMSTTGGSTVSWPASAPRLSIVVLPFANLSDD